ncbi:hypothetical protein BC628DRAFT_417469 [Trametes gibbosa]|nr:hypothetical protein BC628DRAFT_417469 [Trametes gibbosa]
MMGNCSWYLCLQVNSPSSQSATQMVEAPPSMQPSTSDSHSQHKKSSERQPSGHSRRRLAVVSRFHAISKHVIVSRPCSNAIPHSISDNQAHTWHWNPLLCLRSLLPPWLAQDSTRTRPLLTCQSLAQRDVWALPMTLFVTAAALDVSQSRTTIVTK